VSTPFAHYPRWAQTLAHGIRARLGNTFILHGNTHDVVPLPFDVAQGSPERSRGAPATDPAAARGFVPLTAFLADWMFGQRDVVIEYQRANGPAFHTRESHQHFSDAVAVVDAVHGTDLARSLPRDPAVFFSLLDSFLKQVIHRESPLGVAVILPYVETLIPESSGESSAEDRAVRVFIQKWATDPSLLSANVTFVLITENLADISSRIVRSPQTVEVEVDRPDEAERLAFVEAVRPAEWFAAKSDLPAVRLAEENSLVHQCLHVV